VTTGTRKTGEFCWINMLTPQPAEARTFFGTLLGWTYVEMRGIVGHVVEVGGRKKLLGTDADSTHHGAPSWFETMTTDVDRATTFYSGLFGWTRKVMPGSKYTTFKHGTADVAGMMPITPQMGKSRPHWATYFTVKDADETAREAVTLGATLGVPIQDVSGIGRFCGITSPQGVTFYVITYTR